MKFPDDILINVGNAVPPQASVGDPEEKKKSIYQARLKVNEGGSSQEFHTWLDDNFSISVSSTWGDAFSGSIVSDMLPPGLQKVIASLNIPTNFWLTNLQTWQGTSPISVSLPFTFRAEENALTDVVIPARNLASYALPREEGGMLVPPGPTIADEIKEINDVKKGISGAMGGVFGGLLKDGEHMILEIGNFLIFRPVIINSVNLEFGTQFDIDGNPLSIKANVELTTFFVGTRKYFKSFFRTAGN